MLGIIVVNKWDLAGNHEGAEQVYEQQIRHTLKLMEYVPIHFTSAITGKNVHPLLDLAIRVFKEREYRFTTRQLNDIIKRAALHHSPPGSNSFVK